MQFNSLHFLIFFPIVVLGYFLLPKKLKKPWLLALSYYFYMCWNAVYALLIFFSTLSTWVCANFVSRENASPAVRKTALGVNVTVNLAILFSFKYYGMFAELLQDAAALVGIGLQLPVLSLLLPVGISFYTFQALGYSIDVYRGTVQHERNFLNYALFVSFFPQLVAGPIERSANLLPQFQTYKKFSYQNYALGMRLMLLGFFKKVVIADNLSVVMDRYYDNLEIWPGPLLVLGTVLFTVQIYCDFSAYSDIARGAAKVLGFELMKNFDHPYFARSISEFWHRWHISLSQWFRDYVYIPLGGNRRGMVRKRLNLFVTFMVSGLWHGANWTYVAWGALHGLYQIVENIIAEHRKKLGKTVSSRCPHLRAVMQTLFTFTLVCFAYIFFRSDTFDQAWYIISHSVRGWGVIFSPMDFWAAAVSLMGSVRVLFIVLFAAAVLFVLEYIELRRKEDFARLVEHTGAVSRWVIYYALLFAIALFGCFEASSFIYFQF